MVRAKKADVEVMKPEETTDMVRRTAPTMNIEALMNKALTDGAAMDVVERLVALYERQRAEWAKRQFTAAMSKFKGECGAIVKSKPVFKKGASASQMRAFRESGDMEGVQYLYSPLEDIFTEATPKLSNNGFSFMFKSSVNAEKMELKAVCIITHVDGHSEPVDPNADDAGFTIPIGSDYMSKQQMFGAAMSFAKRYAFLNATGLQPTGEDPDAPEVDKDKSKPKGGADHRFTEPQSKSGKKKGGDGPASEPGAMAAKFPDIKRAGNDTERLTSSNTNTMLSTMKRQHITEERFIEDFGFPVAQCHKGGLNSIIDWIKEVS